MGLCDNSSEPGACFRFCVSFSLPLLCSRARALALSLSLSLKNKHWGAWVAQLVKHPTLAQVMISQFVGSSPTSDSVLTAQSLEPASDSVSLSLSAPTLLTLCFSVSLKNK